MAHWLIVVATFATILHGSITYYSRNLMERVYANRLAMHHVKPCPSCVGMIAVIHRQDVGKRAYLLVDGATIGPVLIVDCAAAKDHARLEQRGLVAEVSYPLAERLGMVGVGPLYDVDMVIVEPQGKEPPQ